MEPGGCGLAATFHVKPFQCSMRMRFWFRCPPRKYSPTAQQFEELGQEIDDRKLYVAPTGLGLLTMTHCDPFQRSTSVLRCSPSESPLAPTAMQLEVPLHATPPSWLDGTGRFGLFTMDQAEPFQCSTRVRVGGGVVVGCGEVRVELPTAVQFEAPVQEMPERSACVCAGGAGPRMIDHWDPFQRSMSALGGRGW